MKKTIALILTLLMLVPAMISCASSTTAAEETTTPATESVVPTTETAEPTTETAEPVTETAEPTTETAEPTTETPVEPSTETPVEPSTETPVPADPAVLLPGKTVLFCGDSLCMASTYDKEHQWWGWAGRINAQYGLKSYKNVGVDGASVSNCRGDNTIIRQINNNRGKFDIVLLEGSTNDAWDSVEVGKMVEATPEETSILNLDLATFAGGLENLFFYAKKYNPDSKIGYIFNYPLNSATGRMKDMTEYLAEAKKICEKWGVPMLNLYEDKNFVIKQFAGRGLRVADGIHPTSQGYDILVPYIAQFMADLLAG